MSAGLALVCIATTAQGAPLVQISYDVTGGSFGGTLTNSTGSITGGTLVFTPDVPTSTPFYTVGDLTLSLTGPSGFFSLRITSASLGVGVGLPGLAGLEPLGARDYVNSNGSIGPADGSVGTVLVAPIGYVTLRRTEQRMLVLDAYHRYFLGNEVRVFAPEPGPGVLLAVGGVAMAAAASAQRVASRRRAGQRGGPLSLRDPQQEPAIGSAKGTGSPQPGA